MKPSIIWTTLLIVLYALFCLWYGGIPDPLSPEEVETYMSRMRSEVLVNLEATVSDQDRETIEAFSQEIERIEAFLLADDGRSFVMVNLLNLNDVQPETAPEDQPNRLLNEYSSGFFTILIGRAGHPVLLGGISSQPIDLWGMTNAAEWTSVGLVRYRSRRDFAEIATSAGIGDVYPLKIRALEQTLAVPASPWWYAGDPRLLLGLLVGLPLLTWWGGRLSPRPPQ
ncbi:MAG: hypothetical protein ACOYL5_05675 [Phototrophicaceae bacterium]